MIGQMKRQQRLFRITLTACISMILFFTFFFLTSFGRNNDRQVLRTRGIVIVDDKGNERILIGAPFPFSRNRIRTDFEKSKAAWGSRFGGQFDWYKTNPTITNDGAGILIMDEKGHDRLSIGAPAPSSWIGRIAPVTGITINDEEGSERGGFGLIKGGKYDRMVLGLDHATGYEGATIAAFEDGSTALSFSDPDNTGRVKLVNDKGMLSQREGIPANMSGLILKDAKGKTKTLLNGEPANPVLIMKDTSGAIGSRR